MYTIDNGVLTFDLNVDTVDECFSLDENQDTLYTIHTIVGHNITHIGDSFLLTDRLPNLKTLLLNKVEIVGRKFMSFNDSIETVHMDSVKTIGSGFLYWAPVEHMSMSKVEYIDEDFVRCPIGDYFTFPELLSIGDKFMCEGHNIKQIYAPKLRTLGNMVLHYVNNSCDKLSYERNR